VTPRHRITWSPSTGPAGTLLAIEPSADELAQHAAALTAAYNDPHNAPLLGHTELMTERDVIAHYGAVSRDGGHNFLVFRDGALVADADLRHVTRGAAEFAFMVAAVSAQGQGLGTRIATMIHAFAFATRRLDRVYATAAGRAYADEPDDVVLVIDRSSFEQSHAWQLAEIAIEMR